MEKKTATFTFENAIPFRHNMAKLNAWIFEEIADFARTKKVRKGQVAVNYVKKNIKKNTLTLTYEFTSNAIPGGQ